ncbi:MAG: NYN domain-containing protein [Woeseiaceae bacterium]|nr:NYN domain-containing protein [Woeseiaceae bacterium]NIP19964.1 NYN domain-containing protein [Woeseiaceae bacterium]NIS88760.1 NYN domain-containing protein [Woeseiaceae bacterium]
MATNYVLIDYENVHPKNLELLVEHPFKVFVFVGQNQAKVPFDLADSMQLLGKDAKYIKIAGTGQNALDFHIAYYVGQLAAKEPDAHFHIISKDKGFDPLIRHLKERKIRVRREKDLGEIPLLQLPTKASLDEKISAIVKNLGGRGQSRPRKVRTLQNTINSLFTKKLDQSELNELVDEMKKRKLIVVRQNNVSYKLPH